ncbi:serine hydrolase domain-containing protein [Sphingomicrobium aestuariivivum]|uniref:serine hydrolase domain-containing protein n=1 Tax=Sphingomicrobium aestuariivivum TaxID=1582356 RepID=UPI001FD693C5|nr:serine hydrolase domain-containing protein [Sphingomicrobium aestuariivivum]MCJ8191101.1 beta-lactamase family protein [Sphingomicrobium aestuariivivum]
MFLSVATLLVAAVPAEGTPLDRAIEALVPGTVIVGEEPAPSSIHEAMAELRVPAVSIALIDDNRIVAARSFGWADPAQRVPAHLDTRFQAASLSKSVAAMTMMALVEAGALDLDLPVNARLSRWRLPEGEHAPATLRSLLSHRAGTSVSGFPGYADPAATPDLVAVLEGRGNTDPVELVSAPGTFSYSGGGYSVAQLLVEEVEGQPFADVAARVLLVPLGMDRSSFAQPPRAAREKLALAHDEQGRLIAGGYHLYPEQAAAGLWTTPRDLALFLIAANRAHAGETGLPVGPAGMRTLLTAPGGDSDYALGFGTSGSGADFRIGHSGSNMGYKAYMFSFPERGEGLVIMTNGELGAPLFQSIAAAVAREMDWPGFEQRRLVRAPATPEALARIAGVYLLDERAFAFSVDGDRLSLRNPQGEIEPSILIEGDRLYFPQGGQIVDVERGPGGEVTALVAGDTRLPRAD